MADLQNKYLDLTGLSRFLEKLDARYAKPSDINDATLTIQQNEITIDTFTANDADNVVVNIVTPQVLRFI